MWPFKHKETEDEENERLYGIRPDGKPFVPSVPNLNWYKSNKFKRDSLDQKDKHSFSNRDIVPCWYKCKVCGIEFQTSPPSYHAFGDMDSLYDVCPDCENK